MYSLAVGYLAYINSTKYFDISVLTTSRSQRLIGIRKMRSSRWQQLTGGNKLKGRHFREHSGTGLKFSITIDCKSSKLLSVKSFQKFAKNTNFGPK